MFSWKVLVINGVKICFYGWVKLIKLLRLSSTSSGGEMFREKSEGETFGGNVPYPVVRVCFIYRHFAARRSIGLEMTERSVINQHV